MSFVHRMRDRIYPFLVLFLGFSGGVGATSSDEDIPILEDYRCGDSVTASGSTTSFEYGGRQEKKEALLPEDNLDPRPYHSQILQARHPEKKGLVDATNPRRGEGLPYRCTENLEGLVKDYKDKKWDGRRLDLSYGSYNGANLEKLFTLQDLVYLDLSGNPLSVEDIRRLSCLSGLEELHLANLPLQRNGIYYAEIEKLKKQLPKCSITF